MRGRPVWRSKCAGESVQQPQRVQAVLERNVRRSVSRAGEAGSAGIGGLERALIVEMDVGDDRDVRRAHDLLEARGRGLVRAGDPDDVGARLLAAADLVDRRLHVRGRRVGHGLDGDRRVAADRHVADHDLAGLTARDIAPRANGHGRHIGFQRLEGKARGTGCGAPDKGRMT